MDFSIPRPVFFITGFLLPALFAGCKKEKTYSVKTETVVVKSLSQIVPVSDILVKPVMYTNISGLENLPVPEAKAKFISAVLPALLVAKHGIDMDQLRMRELSTEDDWSDRDSIRYLDLKRRYKAADLADLLERMGTLPNCIVLAQAAVESGWGQSRFFRQGNNLFGIWSYNTNEPRIPAGKTRQNKTIYIRTYENMSASIIHYFEILGSAPAYNDLRKARLEKSDPFELLPHLKNFSERRTSYTNQLKAVILQNELTQYDKFTLDPQYLIED